MNLLIVGLTILFAIYIVYTCRYFYYFLKVPEKGTERQSKEIALYGVVLLAPFCLAKYNTDTTITVLELGFLVLDMLIIAWRAIASARISDNIIKCMESLWQYLLRIILLYAFYFLYNLKEIITDKFLADFSKSYIVSLFVLCYYAVKWRIYTKGNEIAKEKEKMDDILILQKMAYKTENWYRKNPSKFLGVMIISAFLFVLFSILNLWWIATFLMMVLFIGWFLEKNLDWCISPMKFFIKAVFMNFCIVLILTGLAGDLFSISIISEKAIINMLFLLYMFLWLYSSLIAQIDVAKLVNEVLAGITTTIFTFGTFYLSVNTSANTDSIFLKKLYTEHPESEKFLMEGFGLLLPYIGITTLSLATLSIKAYWLKKNNRHDIWDDIETISSENNAKSKIMNHMANMPDNITDETEILNYLNKQINPSNVNDD